MGGTYDEEERHNLDELNPPPKMPPPPWTPVYDYSDGFAKRMDDPIKVSVSAEQTVNLGNYESAKVFFSLSNIPSGATEEQIEAALETGELIFKYVKNEVGKQAGIVRLNMEK